MTATTYGTIPLMSQATCGAAFDLRANTRRRALVTVEGWEVEVADDQRVVVARGTGATGYDEASDQGSARAQEGLDLMSTVGMVHGAIDRPDDIHLAWWATPTGTTLGIRSVIQSYLHVGVATGVVTRTDGTVVAGSGWPVPTWHPSFRYYRLAQTTDDLFDAFRNTYLALEAILSDIAPQRHGEGEGQWVRRALAAADAVVPLAPLVPAGTADAVEYVRQHVYVDTRTAMSHAKIGRPVLLPRNQGNRAQVVEALRLTYDLYLHLAEAHLGLRRQSGFVTSFAFQGMATAGIGNMRLCISDDLSPMNPQETVLNPAGGTLLWFDTPELADTSRPFEVSRTWTLPTAELRELEAVRRVLTAVDATPAFINRLEADLVIGDDIDTLTFTFCHRGINTGSPRDRYPL